MTMNITLTNREADLMAVLWEQGPATVAEVREALNDALAYTTVLTVLRTLEDKGYVTHEEAGRAHRYRAVVERDQARASAVAALAHKLFKGSTELLLTHVVSDERLSDEDLERIRELIDRRAGELKS
jgi:BlaI family penicillinase repressor